MSDNNISRFLIAGTNSGCGKTTLTLGILRALTRRGLAVAPFKCGPDYIDAALHRAAAGRPSFNLDVFFGSLAGFGRRLAEADIAVVEGVMGLFDGTEPGSIRGSSAEIAALLDLPVILTVNARGLSGSIAPLVRGFADWHPLVHIVGVIANQVGSARHAEILRGALEAVHLPPLIGWLPRDERWSLPERHLGLVDKAPPLAWFDALAGQLEESLELERLLDLTRMPRPVAAPPSAVPVTCRLGVARDEAFSFYYEENFELLRHHGVEPVSFSPLRDRELPPGLSGLYFGGGYPELYAEQLAGNAAMKCAIRAFAREHLVYGECGGYLYLLEGFSDCDGGFHPGLGLLPGRAQMNRKPAALGYREATGIWGRVRGHEFHYSSLEAASVGPCLWELEDLRGNRSCDGAVAGRVKGGYLHWHFASSPEALQAFLRELHS